MAEEKKNDIIDEMIDEIEDPKLKEWVQDFVMDLESDKKLYDQACNFVKDMPKSCCNSNDGLDFFDFPIYGSLEELNKAFNKVDEILKAAIETGDIPMSVSPEELNEALNKANEALEKSVETEPKSSTHQSDIYTSLAVGTAYEMKRLQIMMDILDAKLKLIYAQYDYFEKMRKIYSSNEHEDNFTELNSIY